ncbi:MAG: ATP-binding protein [Myxococcota bacterium]
MSDPDDDRSIRGRCETLSAQLAILSGISAALTRAGADGGGADGATAVDEALAACFADGPFAVGALVVLSPRRVRWFGALSVDEAADRAVMHDVARLDDGVAAPARVVVPGDDPRTERIRDVLGRAGVLSAVIAPLSHRDELLGAVLLGSRSAVAFDADQRAFATGIGSQVALGLALARTFDAERASERTARDAATTLRAVIDGLDEGVAVVDAAGVPIYWNAAAEQFHGPTSSATGAEPTDRTPSGDRARWRLCRADRVTPVPAFELPIARAVAGETVERLELHAIGPGREGRTVLASAKPLVPVGGAVAIYRDVTAERVAQEQLMVSDRMASVGQLAAGVAHEITNPLSTVLTNLELALAEVGGGGSDERSARIRAELTDALDAVARVRDVASDLRMLSRSTDQSGPVDVHRVLDAALRLARNQIRRRATVVRRFGTIAMVHGNPSKLGQVFVNLLVNAAESIQAGRPDLHRIVVSTRMTDTDRVLIEIEDSGDGLSPDAMTRLFAAFYSVGPAAGPGLGLALCSQIVKGMGGEIGAEGTAGEGSVLWVTLPAAGLSAPPPAVAGPGEPPVGPAGLRKARILVIDDDPMILSVVRRTLEPIHAIVGTLDPTDALARIARGERYDLVLSDLAMPTASGIELYEEIKRIVPDQASRLMFVTGATTGESRRFVERVGVPQIDKPFDTATLRARVAERLAFLGRLP